jgi:hypothetical protein
LVDQTIADSDEDNARNAAINQAISEQLFYFIRDLCHTHQHHAPNSDTIATLQTLKSRNDVNWANNIIYSLYYYIISNKRNSDFRKLKRSIGVISYLDSFRKIVKKHYAKSKINVDLPVFEDKNIEASIISSFDEKQIIDGNKKRNKDRVFNWATAAFSLSFAFLSVIFIFTDGDPDRDPIMVAISHFIAQKATFFVIIVPSFLFVLIMTSRTKFGVLAGFEWFRDIIRLMIVKRKIWSAIMGLISLMSFFVFLYVKNLL